MAHLPPDRIHPSGAQFSADSGAAAFLEESSYWLRDTLTEGTEGKPASHPATEAVILHRPRILLADDNADMRDYVRRILARRYNVDAVADGEARSMQLATIRPI